MVKKHLIKICVFSFVLAMILVLGVATSLWWRACRAEWQQYYESSNSSQFSDADYINKQYRLILESDEAMALLHRAATKNELYYKLATEYICYWEFSQNKDEIHSLWLPHDLGKDEYLESIVPLLSDIYIPVLPNTHEKVFDYDLVMIRRRQNDSPSNSSLVEQIRVRYLLRDRTSGHEDYACEISILVDPQYRINRGAEGNRDELYTTLTTSDGYDINYYVNEHSPTPEPGSCWGEVYVTDGQPLYYSIATWRGETLVEYGLPTYLSDSTLISYAEHLETDETLRTEVSKQWNTISLIYYGIILYGILVLAMGAATVVFAMRWRKKKKCERQLANHV